MRPYRAISVRIFAHLVTRALDRAFRVAEEVEREYPGLSVEVFPEWTERVGDYDPDDPPRICFVVDDGHDERDIKVGPWYTGRTMRKALDRAARELVEAAEPGQSEEAL